VSSGHRSGRRHQFSPQERNKARQYLREPKFKSALANYSKTDDTYAIPYLAGSDNNGTTVYYDKSLPKRIRVQRKSGAWESIDPRKFLWWHEAPEGILIRDYGLGYPPAHCIATVIERMHVEASGYDWDSYDAALRPSIRDDESEIEGSNPPTLLLTPYKGTHWYKILAREEKGQAHG
jgi:hypothetical protein